jgi:hypothetical protein
MLSAGSRFSVLMFWLALLAVLMVASVPVALPLPPTATDKVQHVFAFLVLALLGLRAYPGARPVRLLAGLALYGALIELIQLIPALNRFSDWRDWIADLSGIAVVLAIRAVVRGLRRPDPPLSSGRPASSNAAREGSPDRTRDP